jgi:hypothetical protein
VWVYPLRGQCPIVSPPSSLRNIALRHMTTFKCSRVVPVLLLLLLSLTLTCVVASLHLWYTYTNELLDLLTVECVCAGTG